MRATELESLLQALGPMPGWVGAAVAKLGDERARHRAADGGFSLVEHVWHLADLEAEGFAGRLRRIREEDEPHLPDFDGARLARERQYGSRDVREGLQVFARARAANLATLRGVSADEWSRRGIQEAVGPVALADIPRMMAEHDASHRQEIGALLGEVALE
jgi:DinB family protein